MRAPVCECHPKHNQTGPTRACARVIGGFTYELRFVHLPDRGGLTCTPTPGHKAEDADRWGTWILGRRPGNGAPLRARVAAFSPPMRAWLEQPHGRRHKAPPQSCAWTTHTLVLRSSPPCLPRCTDRARREWVSSRLHRFTSLSCIYICALHGTIPPAVTALSARGPPWERSLPLVFGGGCL